MVFMVRRNHVVLTKLLHQKRRQLKNARKAPLAHKLGEHQQHLSKRKHAQLRFQWYVLATAHNFVRCVKHKNFIQMSEGCRIILNFAKVTGHLCTFRRRARVRECNGCKYLLPPDLLTLTSFPVPCQTDRSRIVSTGPRQ